MARRKEPLDEPLDLPPPAKTIEGREAQLIYAAQNLVERRMADGTASAQETVHFLKLGSVRNILEQDKLRSENDVLAARIKDLESRKSGEGLYAKALNAFRGYSGQESVFDEDEEYNEDL